jgi:hypothetical protein
MHNGMQGLPFQHELPFRVKQMHHPGALVLTLAYWVVDRERCCANGPGPLPTLLDIDAGRSGHDLLETITIVLTLSTFGAIRSGKGATHRADEPPIAGNLDIFTSERLPSRANCSAFRHLAVIKLDPTVNSFL